MADVVRVGQVDDDRVELLGGGPQPGERVVVEQVTRGSCERSAVERAQLRAVGASQINYRRVEVDDVTAAHVRVSQDFAQGQTVAAAEDQHPPRAPRITGWTSASW